MKATPGSTRRGFSCPAPTAPADSRCFPIRDITLKGADSLPAADRERLLKPYVGQCLGVSQLNDLLKAITDYYIDKGRVTSRAYLPQQDLSSGHLQVLVVEGKLEGLKGAQGSTVTDRELAMAFPGKVGEALSLREAEQRVDQLNRLAPNGALISGSDLSLMAGTDLDNVGTLRASSGLMDASGRLDLLNQRTVTTHESTRNYRPERSDFVDNAAQAKGDVNITASQTLTSGNIGSRSSTQPPASLDAFILATARRETPVSQPSRWQRWLHACQCPRWQMAFATVAGLALMIGVVALARASTRNLPGDVLRAPRRKRPPGPRADGPDGRGVQSRKRAGPRRNCRCIGGSIAGQAQQARAGCTAFMGL